MAFVHGKNTNFKIDNAAGALQDISAYLTNVDHPDTTESADTTAFGATRKTRIAGVSDGSLSIQGNWDATVDAILAGIKGLIGTYEYGPAGGTTGLVRYTGECLCTSYQVTSPVSGQATFSAAFELTGTQTRDTF